MRRTRVILVLALAGIGIAILLVKLDAERRAVRESRCESSAVHGNEWHDGPMKRYLPPTAEELLCYRGITDALVAAYSNGMENAMLERAKSFPPAVYGLRGEDRRKVILPINLVWFDEWIRNKDLQEFSSAKEFGRRMRIKLSFARVYGEFLVRSGMKDAILEEIECRALRKLKKYEDKFQKEGKLDFLSAAEGLLSAWVGQIESENGFTRCYIRDYNQRMQWVIKRGESTPEALRLHIRSCVNSFQRFCGYTPKWLDEEFPPLAAKVPK